MSVLEESFWKNGPRPGSLYNFPGDFSGPANQRTLASADPTKHTLSPSVTGSSVIGIKFDHGVIIASDTLGSYGSLAKLRTLSRALKVNESTVMAAGGDYADFQYIKGQIEQKVISDECVGDGYGYTAASLHSWLTRIFYSRRSKFNPLWNSVVVGGIVGEKPYLGYLDMKGSAHEDTSVATGYGQYFAQTLMREALDKKSNGVLLTEQEARELIKECMKVLYYRDARSWNVYELSVVKREAGLTKSIIEGPFKVEGDWSIAHLVSGLEIDSYGGHLNGDGQHVAVPMMGVARMMKMWPGRWTRVMD